MNDLPVGASDEFTWYYAAGELAQLDDIIGEVAAVSGAMQNITYTTADFKATATVNSTGYWMIVPQNATAPTAAQIKAGTNYGSVVVAQSGSGAMTANVEKTFNLTGLTPGTSYDLYFVSQNSSQAFSSIVRVPFATTAYVAPTISTAALSAITNSGASSGGNITADGGREITARGVVWNTTGTPTLADNHTTDGAGTGTYSSTLTSLAPNTTYYVRAYATNSVGTSYGSQVTFTTPPADPTSVSPSASQVCQGGTATLTANGAQGTVYWYTGSCGGTQVGTGNSLTVTPASTTTYYARNYNGTYSGCASVTVTVGPNTPPTPTVAELPTITAECSASVTAPTATDHCGGTITGMTTNPTAYNTQGSYTITWTYTDSRGNSTTQSQIVVIRDVTPPAIICPSPVEVHTDANSCGAVVNYATPNTITFSQQFIQGQPSTHCDEWKAFLNQLLPNLSYTKLTIKGSLDPTGVSLTNPLLVAQVANALKTGTAASFSDGNRTWRVGACGEDGTGAAAIEVNANGTICNCEYGYTVRPCIQPHYNNPNWGGANTQTCNGPSQTLTVVFELGGSGSGITATDNCNGPVTITQTAGLPSGSLFPVGTTTNTFEATDAAGNKTTCSFEVTVTDTERPTVITRDITLQLDAQGKATLTAAQINNGSADNCSIPEDGYSLSKTSFDCSNTGENEVTLTVTDTHGNTASATAIVTIEDKAAPTVLTTNITIQLDEQGAATITPAQVNAGSTDNCSIPANGYSLSKSSFNCSNTGTNTVVLTVTDAHGNSASAEAIVTVEDKTGPTVVTQDITVQLDAAGQASITAAQINNGSSDACGIASVTLNKTSFDCSNIGANTVTLTVTDTKGNVATGTATVTVQDNLAPTALARNITVQLDATGNVSITPGQVNNGSTDNCTIASVALSKSDFDCSNVGANVVTLTVTDVNGNAGTATATVTVEDQTAPVVVTKNITVQLDAAGTATITPAQVNNGSSDVCGIRSMTLSKSAFTCSNTGANTVTLTVEDNNGNTATATAVVTVEDKTAPVVSTRNLTVALVNGAATITAAQIDNGSSDACGIASRTLSKTSFNCGELGNHTVTLTVTDVHGNTSTGTAVVSVEGVIPSPAITVSRTNATYTGAGNEKTIFIGYGAQGLDLAASDASTPAATQYSWSPVSFLGNATSATATYTPDATQEGDRTFTVTATNGYGCSATANVTIKVVDARCGGDLTKINMCHVAGNDATHLKTICIEGGSVADHLAKGCRIDACPTASMVSIGTEPETLATGFALKAMPNPSTAYFTLTVESSNGNEKVSLRVLDIKGRLVEVRNNLQPNQTLRIGDSYRPGIYFIEVVQGTQRSQAKLIKMGH